MKKSIVFGIIFLLISVCVIPSTGTIVEQTTTGDVITVDDEGDGDYTSIKEAVNNANSGDIIEVYSGTYYDYDMIIDKDRITLIGISYELGSGNDTGQPFLDIIDEDVIIIKADSVKIINLLFDNNNNYKDAIIISNGNSCIIENNTILNHYFYGILISGANHIIRNNYINHCGTGISGSFSNVSIVGNTINYTIRGIILGEARDSLIKRNRISNASEVGIKLVDSSFNVITQNIIENNGHYTLKRGWGIWITEDWLIVPNCMSNLISKNNFINNSLHIGCYYLFFGRNKFENNYYDNWIGFGPKLIRGIRIIFIIPIPFLGAIEIPIPRIQFDRHPAKEPHDIEV